VFAITMLALKLEGEGAGFAAEADVAENARMRTTTTAQDNARALMIPPRI
jgi:hypothetical protein